jgi:hypothetical protein
MKNIVAKVVALSLILAPLALTGCQKKCGHHEPEMHHKHEKMKKECGGK